MSSSESAYIQLLSSITVYFYQYGNLTIYTLGNVGNLLSALVFFKKSWSKNVCVLYFKVCLFLSSAYLNCAILATSFISGFHINAQNHSVILCKLANYGGRLFSTILPTVLVLASIDRLLISSQNVDTRLYSSKRLAYFSISISVVVWTVFHIHTLIKVDVRELYPSVFVCYSDPSKLYTDFVSYSSMILNCLFCLLMITLSVLSVRNVRRIRAIPRQKRDRIRSMTKKDFQLLRSLFALDLLYSIVSIFPCVNSIYSIVVATRVYTPTPVEGAVGSFFRSFSTFVYFIFYGVLFSVFFGVSRAFRQDLKRMIFKLFCQDVMPLRDEDIGQNNPTAHKMEANIAVVGSVEQPVACL